VVLRREVRWIKRKRKKGSEKWENKEKKKM